MLAKVVHEKEELLHADGFTGVSQPVVKYTRLVFVYIRVIGDLDVVYGPALDGRGGIDLGFRGNELRVQAGQGIEFLVSLFKRIESSH